VSHVCWIGGCVFRRWNVGGRARVMGGASIEAEACKARAVTSSKPTRILFCCFPLALSWSKGIPVSNSKTQECFDELSTSGEKISELVKGVPPGRYPEELIGGGGGNRTRVRKHYILRHYMFSFVFVSRRALPNEQGRREASSGIL
jgi:hypothetical protein